MAVKKRKTRGRPRKSQDERMMLVSFRLAPDLYAVLEEHAEGETDDGGQPLTPMRVAQRLLSSLLKKMKK